MLHNNKNNYINNNYDDIINLSRPVSKKHKPMAVSDRAAQFAPFAALTGHGDAIKETARITSEKSELEEDAREKLNDRLRLIRENIKFEPEVKIIYFSPDEKKAGGTYLEYTGFVKKIDEYEKKLVMKDKTSIYIDEIREIESDLFKI